MVFSKGKIFLVMCEKEIWTVTDWKFHPNTEQMVPPLSVHLNVSHSPTLCIQEQTQAFFIW